MGDRGTGVAVAEAANVKVATVVGASGVVVDSGLNVAPGVEETSIGTGVGLAVSVAMGVGVAVADGRMLTETDIVSFPPFEEISTTPLWSPTGAEPDTLRCSWPEPSSGDASLATSIQSGWLDASHVSVPVPDPFLISKVARGVSP